MIVPEANHYMHTPVIPPTSKPRFRFRNKQHVHNQSPLRIVAQLRTYASQVAYTWTANSGTPEPISVGRVVQLVNSSGDCSVESATIRGVRVVERDFVEFWMEWRANLQGSKHPEIGYHLKK